MSPKAYCVGPMSPKAECEYVAQSLISIELCRISVN